MKKALYLECNSGISGDMTVAALLDLGADQKVLEDVLKSLPLCGFETVISRVKKSAVDCCDFDVKLESENHDHDMDYLFGHERGEDEEEHAHDHAHGEHQHGDHEHTHEHGHEHYEHTHEHGHEHGDHVHTHEHGHGHEGQEHTHEHAHEHGEHKHGHHHDEHRGLKEVTAIIRAGQMTERAKQLAIRIFEIVAEAEAKAHGVPVSQVHFHEVGAVDSIVDIVSVAVCFDNLGVSEVIIPSMTEGQGTIRCQHGILPIPVPAVANISAAHGLPLRFSNISGELITPTGAAIAAALKTSEELPEDFVVRRVGLGAGKREYKCPGFLRAMLLDLKEKAPEDTIIKLESNIDDCSGEVLGYVMDRLFEAGARDVYYQPVFMKKNRPAWLLSVLCTEDCRENLEAIIFRETTTIGIRRCDYQRTVLPRTFEKVSTPYGPVTVKLCSVGAQVFCYPEYESVKKAAQEASISFSEVYQAAIENYKKDGVIHE